MIKKLTKRLKRNLICSMTAVALCIAVGTPTLANADVNLWPIYESTDTETTVLYPFYVKEKEFLMIFPLYYRANSGKDHHLLWPLVKVSDGRVARVAPVWFSEKEGTFFLFPLVMKRPNSFLSIFPPVYYEKGGSALAVMPFFSRSSYTNSSSQETSKKLSVLWPLYSKKEVRAANGELVSQKRRWLLFSDQRNNTGYRKIRFLGIPVSERMS